MWMCFERLCNTGFSVSELAPLLSPRHRMGFPFLSFTCPSLNTFLIKWRWVPPRTRSALCVVLGHPKLDREFFPINAVDPEAVIFSVKRRSIFIRISCPERRRVIWEAIIKCSHSHGRCVNLRSKDVMRPSAVTFLPAGSTCPRSTSESRFEMMHVVFFPHLLDARR